MTPTWPAVVRNLREESRTMRHFVGPDDIRWLEGHFATFTIEGGWVVPEWLQLMARTCRKG